MPARVVPRVCDDAARFAGAFGACRPRFVARALAKGGVRD
jgi:hypothetical protein